MPVHLMVSRMHSKMLFGPGYFWSSVFNDASIPCMHAIVQGLYKFLILQYGIIMVVPLQLSPVAVVTN